ncbi:MAG: transposase [Psychromonas sp.]|jgi:transposase
MNIKVVGIDLAKHYFQVCVLTDQDEIHSNKKVTRARLLDVLRQFPEGTLIAIEACATSNYWARTFAKMGFKIKLIPPQQVKPFVGHQKMMLMMPARYVKLYLVQVFIAFQQKLSSFKILNP